MKNYKLVTKAQSILTFRKWGRKNFSLFLTLNKVVVISVLAVSYLISAPLKTIAIVQDTSDVKMEYDLEEIEVSAQRSPALYSQVARIISVIESKEIGAAPAQSVQDLLEYIAGVDVRQRGTEGVQADISIRGGTFDQTLILLNGINITDPQTGHHNLNIPLSLYQIERIEILEGPAARVYGPNAFSGAINIITKKPDSKLVRLILSGGQHGFYNLNLSGTFNTSKLNHLVALNRKSSKGYINNTDFNNSTIFYSNQLNSLKGEFESQIAYSGKEFGANSFYTPKYPNQFEETKTLFSSIKWQSNSKFHLSPLVYYRRNQDRFELFRDNPAAWYEKHNYHLTNVFGGSLNSWFQWKLGKTSFGAEMRSENILSNILGEGLDTPRAVPGENAEFTKSKSRNTISGFFEHAWYYNNWTFTGGLLVNQISGSDYGLKVFPGLDFSYQVVPAIKIFSSYNTSLRMPTFTDLYYAGPTNIGNPDLKPEKSATFEAGLKLKSTYIKGNFVVFYRKGKDIIDWVKKDNNDVWQAQNLTKLNSLGTELQLLFLLKEKFGKHFPNKVNLSYFNNNLKKENHDFISNYVLDNLKHKLVAGINQSLSKNISFDLKFVYQDREGTFTKYNNTIVGKELEYQPFWKVDGKIIFEIEKLNVFLSVNNIFDKRYYDIGNVIQPGRWIKAGVSYRLNFD